MEKATPELNVATMLPLAPPVTNVEDCPTSNFHNVSKIQFEQLAAQMSLIAAWITYHDLTTAKWRSLIHYSQAATQFDSLCLSYLSSADWLTEPLPLLEIRELVLPASTHAYVCSIGQHDSQPEYLLLWTATPLAASQKHAVAQQAHLLSHYLDLARNQQRQSTEIQLLEQILRRAEHQLRNPLALINLYAETLCLGLPAGAPREQAALIRDTVTDLSANLTNLVHCGQRSKLQVTVHNLREILTDSIQGLQPWLTEKQLRLCYPSTDATLMVDRWQIKQVFDNILHNAICFSPVGSQITCQWRVFQQEVVVTITDQGKGLTEADLQKIFVPYYSRRPGGTGLGLAIAQKIILDHHGRLWAENVPGGGAQFSFTLPRKQLA